MTKIICKTGLEGIKAGHTTRGKKHCAYSAKFQQHNIKKRRIDLIDISSEMCNDFLPLTIGCPATLNRISGFSREMDNI